MSAAEVIVAVATGLVAGVYAGLLGVGGGIIMVPSLVILLSVDQQIAQGTSLLVIVATSAAGTIANRRRGLIDVRLALLLGAGGCAGAVVGSLLALRVLDADTLRRIFGVVLLALAARLALRRRAKPDPGSPARAD